jgi:tetratricopeptide (TPR) repeat protein
MDARPPSVFYKGLIEGAVYLLVFFSPLAIGTVEPWAYAVVIAAAVAAFTALALKRRLPDQIAITPLGAVLLVMTLYTGLQTVPLPPSIVAFLSPSGFALQQTALKDAGFAMGWLPISLDRYATLTEFAKLIGYALLFLTIVNYFGCHDRRVRRLLVAMTCAGTLVALIGFWQKFFGGNRIFGVIEVTPRFFISTFVNPNHLAGYLGLVSPVALGLGLSTSDRRKRVVLVTLSAFLGIAVFLTLSRGGMIAFVGGQIFLAGLLWMKRAQNRGRAALIPLFAASVLCVAAWLAYAPIEAKFQQLAADHQAAEGRFTVWGDDLPMMWSYAATGIGRGAYAQMHTRQNTLPAQITFLFAENSYLQAAIDWGVLGLLMILSMVGTAWLAVRQGPGHGKWAGVFGGLLVIALHNFVDFNLETGAGAVAFTILLGLTAARAFADMMAPAWIAKMAVTPAQARLAVPVCLALAVVSFGLGQRYSLRADTARLAAAADQPGDGLIAVAQVVTARHPADYFLALRTASALLRDDRNRPLAAVDWLSRAIHLNPLNATAHLLMARVLCALGEQEQAITSYRLAATLANGDAVLSEALTNISDPGLRRRLAAEDTAGQAHLAHLLLQKGDRDEASTIIDELEATAPDNPLVLQARAEISGRDQDHGRAAAAANKALAQDPHQIWAYLVLASAAAATHSQDPTQIVARGLEQNPDPVLATAAAQYALGQRDFAAARFFAQKLMDFHAVADS